MPTITSEDFFIPTGQGRLFARRWTPGTHQKGTAPIVLLHDSLGCVELWRDFPERLALAAERTVIAYDRLGFGRSDPHPGTLDLGFIGAEADGGFRHLRDNLALDRFVAMGHSVGGGMAIACAARYGRHCQGLITVAAQVFAEERTLAGIREARHSFAQPGQLDRLMKYHGDKAAWVLSAWVDNWLAPGFADWNLDAELRRVDCPVLALHGDQDEYGSTAHAERIAKFTRERAVILADCGHVPQREKPQQVLTLISDWLKNARR